MKNLFSALPGRRWLKPAVLALGLLGGATAAQAQSNPIYALGILTAAGFGQQAGAQVLSVITPSAPTVTAITPISGANQQLVGLDFRPNTGQLYALGYNNQAATNNAQLYVINLTYSGTTLSTAAAVPVGGPITLDLGLSNRTDLSGYNLVVGVGFDFNPRADRIRVTGQNRSNYRLNPNTGALVAQDATLTYADNGNVVQRPTLPLNPPVIGAVAYENSIVGLTSTQLYDIDQTPNEGLVAKQSIANGPSPITNGTLTSQARLLLNGIPPDNTQADIRSANFDLDIYTSTTGQNTAYLYELTRPTTGSNGSSNIYTLNLTSGIATKLGNLIGSSTLRYTNIAALPSVVPYVWTGTAGTDWNMPANWSTGQVPTAANDVFIPGPGGTVIDQPVIVGTGAAKQCRSIVLGAGSTGAASTLTLAAGGTLNVYGNFVNNDGSVPGTGSLALAGAATQDVGGSIATSFPNLLVGVGGAVATTSAAVSIRQSVVANTNLTIGTDQAFTLLSSASGTAYASNAGGTITGLATVQRYITPTNPGPGYRHYSSPVTRNAAAATSNQINDLTVTGVFAPVVNAGYNSSNTPKLVRPYPTVFYYDQARVATSNASYAVGNFDLGFLSPAALTDEFEAARGYTVNLPASALVDFQGTLNQNAQYQRTNLTRGAQTTAGYHLLGNPYPGALNYDVIATAANIPGMESALYVYKSSGQYTGSYTTYVPGSVGNNGGPVATNGGTNNIPVAQGFFMRTGAGQTGTVTIPTGARTNALETALFQRTASTLPLLSMTASNGSIANQTAIYFDQTATPAFDATRDAHYLPATHGLDLASDIGTEALSINGLPPLTGASVAVPLYLHTATAGTYTLTVDELANLPTGYSAYLRDGRSNSYVNLGTTASVSVTLDPADAATGRFTVLFATSQPLANAPATLAALVTLYPNPAHGTATLVLPQALRGQAASQVEVLNALGQVVLRRPVSAISPEAVELPLSGLAAGIYTVRATTATGAVARQLRVE